jgi:hypothetical protein
MPFDAPFKLGPFEVDAAGRISPGQPHASPAFLFRCHDRVVRSRLAQADGNASAGRLILQTTIGRVPSTAGAAGNDQRARSFALLHWLAHSVPAEWRTSLSPDHHVWVNTEAEIDLPITAAALITKITCFALELTPYLELLDEAGVTVRAI